MSVLLLGGYIMDHEQAQAWAQRCYPDLYIDDINFVSNCIANHPTFQQENPDLVCMCVNYEGQSKVLFATVGESVPPCRQSRRLVWREGEKARAYRQALFGAWENQSGLEFLKDLPFVTIYDPYNQTV